MRHRKVASSALDESHAFCVPSRNQGSRNYLRERLKYFLGQKISLPTYVCITTLRSHPAHTSLRPRSDPAHTSLIPHSYYAHTAQVKPPRPKRPTPHARTLILRGVPQPASVPTLIIMSPSINIPDNVSAPPHNTSVLCQTRSDEDPQSCHRGRKHR